MWTYERQPEWVCGCFSDETHSVFGAILSLENAAIRIRWMTLLQYSGKLKHMDSYHVNHWSRYCIIENNYFLFQGIDHIITILIGVWRARTVGSRWRTIQTGSRLTIIWVCIKDIQLLNFGLAWNLLANGTANVPAYGAISYVSDVWNYVVYYNTLLRNISL